MATATRTPESPPMKPLDAAPTTPQISSHLDRPYHLAVDQYERIGAHDILSRKDRVYLWKGLLVAKMTIHPPHAFVLTSLAALMSRFPPDGWHLRQDLPIRLGADSMPEPDLVVVRGVLRAYLEKHPDAADVALLIEVSDSSLAEDRGEVLREYARQGIPIYWIVNIPDRQIEVYTEPSGPAEVPTYRTKRTYRPEDQVAVVLDGREVGRIAVRDVLP